ncbi:Meiosis 1 arrest protein [Larimichthys crocea]|uniref:Uncharacterized protein n=1 Tax=Larimichthys crocea TaxID=215358 RepID=A0ACD3Q4U3_LARCR|nr:Meiosis 1 arrest protein [Larimichthys crocea]
MKLVTGMMTLRADGVCESVLYGLPLVIRPTTCWQLDWDEMETNHNLFHALCHTLRPVVSRELLLPCSQPVPTQEPAPDAVQAIQASLTQLDEEFLLNPLSLSSNLYQHLRSRGLFSQPRYPYRLQPAAVHRDQSQPLDGAKSTGSRQPRQGRQLGANSKVRATVAPFPSSSSHSSSSLGPPPAKASRPALTLLSSSSGGSGGGGGRRAPAPTLQVEDDEDDISMLIKSTG